MALSGGRPWPPPADTHVSLFPSAAIAMLKDKEPGSFIVRDSHSFRGAYGLAMKVATPPPSVLQLNKKGGSPRLFSAAPRLSVTFVPVRWWVTWNSTHSFSSSYLFFRVYFGKYCLGSRRKVNYL